jgi:uncharacterized repeat protein (TIGR01451 family)
MTAGSVKNLKGKDLEMKNGMIVIKKIFVNKSAEFTYTVDVTTNGKRNSPAIEGLELDDYKSTAQPVHDALNKVSIGNKYPTYLYAGTPSGNDDAVLKMTVTPDKTAAKVGETVNYTIALENVSDGDLTGLYLNHDYPAELSISDPGSGSDNGNELSWQRPMLRKGEIATYKFSAKVMSGTPGQRVKSQSRALVNEYDGIAPVDTYLTILGDGFVLAKTGPMGVLMLALLSILSYFGYGAIQRRRYSSLKTAALTDI